MEKKKRVVGKICGLAKETSNCHTNVLRGLWLLDVVFGMWILRMDKFGCNVLFIMQTIWMLRELGLFAVPA